MNRYSDAAIMRFGLATLMLMGLVMVATFNLSKFPGFGGDTYQAEFADAGGLRRGNQVLVGGIRSGRVSGVELDGDKVLVTFEVDHGIELGDLTSASVEVFNLLGEKYLRVTSEGEQALDPQQPIPVERTTAAYDIIGVFSDLTNTTEQIDKDALKQAFNVLSETVDSAAPEIQSSFEGISRISQTIASRDSELKELLASSKNVTKVLADRSDDLVKLMGNADLVFKELVARKEAIHRLLVNATLLARELRGLARDNAQQIGPALAEVEGLLDTLLSRQKEIKATLNALGPYVSILGNIIGTGPWFDAYAVNLLALPSGEFVPGEL